MEILGIIFIAVIVFFVARHRSTARTITKTSNRKVWAQASETRYPRTPRGRFFGRSKPLK
jgi:hypothetical protein